MSDKIKPGKPTVAQSIADRKTREADNALQAFFERARRTRDLAAFCKSPTSPIPKEQINEISRMLPVSLIAATEGYFRSRVKLLVDNCEICAANAAPFMERGKTDHSLVLDLIGKKVSLGDVIAVFVKCNNPNDIITTFGQLMGINVLERICDGSLGSPTGKEFSQWIADVAEIFRLRHIFAHELAPNSLIDLEAFSRCFFSLGEVMKHLSKLLLRFLLDYHGL